MRFARWCMERFGVSEALLGDIEEERRSGRSLLWLAKQVIVAITATVTRDLWLHKFLALRAIIVGWLVCGLAETLAESTDARPLLNWMPMWATFLAGWAVSRLHRRQPAAAVLAYASTYLLIVGAMAIATGRFFHWHFTLGLIMPGCAMLGGFVQRPRRIG